MLEGVSDGELPPGVRPSGFKPLGTCFNSSDCSSGFDCITTDKTICTCDPATGVDTCRPLGSCVMQPCKACEVCVQAMQLFPDIVKGVTKADGIAERFKTFCAGTGRSPLACDATAMAIASSVAGSLGRRVGALCRSLTECGELNSTCTVGVSTGSAPQPLNLCSVEGIVGGTSVPDITGQPAPGSCKTDSDCGAQGTFCSMASTQRVCSCVSSTGAVTCEVYGSCQPTACKVCSDCVAGLQGHVNSTAGVVGADSAAAVAAAFQSTCSSQGNTEQMCAASTMFIASSNKGNLGRRAGALCSVLGKL